MRKINNGYARFDALKKRDRLDVFVQTARDLGASEQAIEKDFWVCRTIDVMFKGFGARPKLYFKGGTSLSKGYGLIKRFSEDIDIVVSRKGLGISEADDPLTQSSNTKRKSATETAMEKCCAFVGGRMKTSIEDLMGQLGCRVELDEEDSDRCTLRIHYPTLFKGNDYVAPWVKVEAGARGAITPCAERAIAPYIQNRLGKNLDMTTPKVAMIEAERTFLEKALILHANHCRIRDNSNWRPSDRNHVARHYSDLAAMRDTPVGRRAIDDDALLEDVRNTKISMFYAAGDKLAEAKRGAIKLVPQPALRKIVEGDYAAMSGMMFHDPPDFDWVMGEIEKLELAINRQGLGA